MKKRRANARQFVICIDNSSYPASLELHKIYTVLPDEKAAEDDFMRVIDESGEDYLYSAKRFVSVELPVNSPLGIKHYRPQVVRDRAALASDHESQLSWKPGQRIGCSHSKQPPI